MRKVSVISTVALLCQIFSVTAQEQRTIFEGALRIKAPDASVAPQPRIKENSPLIHFNFNPVIDFSEGNLSQKYKGIVLKESSLFVVFRCSAEGENGILSLDRGSYNVTVSSRKVTSGNEVKINEGNPKTGAILGFFSNINSVPARKKGNLTLDDLFFADKDGKNQLMELIYIPRMLGPVERDIAETYLSVAYGISQQPGENYLDSKGNKIWDAEDNGHFNFRVTGIGRDDAVGLYQKQSQNSEGDGLSISVGKMASSNAANSSEIADRNFLVWGDNGQSIRPDQEFDHVTAMKRQWKVVPQKSVSTQIRIDLEKMPIRDINSQKQMIWLVVDTLSGTKIDYNRSQYFSAILDDGELVFDNISWNKPSLFSFVQAPEFFLSKEVIAGGCSAGETGKVNLKLVGGMAPYTIRISGGQYEKTITSEKDSAAFQNLPAGNYTIEVRDNRGMSITDAFTTEAFPASAVTLRDKWDMQTAGVRISPVIANNEEGMTFRWLTGKATVSTEKEFFTSTPGIYQLIVKNASGCENTYMTEVVEKSMALSQGWKLFPNPVSTGANFSVEFDLSEPTPVTIAISDVNGKVLKVKNLGNIAKSEYKDTLLTAGTYLIQITKNGVVETAKLIVK